MSAAKDTTRVVAVGKPGTTQQQVVAALSSSASEDEFELLDIVEPSERLVGDIRAEAPDIVLVDHQVGAESFLDVIDEIADHFPTIAIIAIIPSNDPVIAQQVMLAGARAFLIHPFTQINLLSVLRRVRDLESRREGVSTTRLGAAAEQTKQINTIVVYSPRGGSGTTTIATNLAISLYEQTNKRILLVGGKLFFGDLGVMLNLRSNNTIADLIPYAAQMDRDLVNDVVTRHASGIYVLVDPFDVQVAQGIRPQELFNVVQGLQRMFDILIIDVGSALTENAVTIMDIADRVVVVTVPDLASVQDTTRFSQITRSLAYSPDKLFYVLNRTDAPGGVKTKDITPIITQEFFQVPDGGPDVLRSINRGIPLVIRYPRNPSSKAIKKMAGQLSQLMQDSMAALPADGFR